MARVVTMNELHKVLILGASMGLAQQMAELLPKPRQGKVVTDADLATIKAAEEKRKRRQARNQGKPTTTSEGGE